ncbi:unnamed protein product [Nezara viridula]|uniref:Uncharacterized protein n=1 Tax=Nezara viridula TaxID=85310 RepID=A0A9P0MVL1_NEZVI|nr:unnamed protein product [Nezara viridula]
MVSYAKLFRTTEEQLQPIEATVIAVDYSAQSRNCRNKGTIKRPSITLRRHTPSDPVNGQAIPGVSKLRPASTSNPVR